MYISLFKKLVLTLILFSAAHIQVAAQFNSHSWGTSKSRLINSEGTPHSRSGHSLTYLDEISGMECRVIYNFENNKLQSGRVEQYGFKKEDPGTFRQFTYDDADELEAVISSYFKMNERLSQKHGEPARHSIPLTLQQRHQKLEETFDAYPTPSISDEDVDLINRINIKDSNSKRLKKGLIQYSTTWRDSTTLIVHLLYNNTEDRPLNYGNLHHQVIYLNREEHTRANMPRELRVQPR